MKSFRVLSLFLAAAMLLAACGGPAATEAPTSAPAATTAATSAPAATAAPVTGGPVELVYWSMWNQNEPQALAIQQWMDAYTAAHPNVTFSAVWNGRQNQTLLRTALSAGTKVDLMDQDADQVAGGMMTEGLGLPLDNLLSETALDENVPLKDVFLPGTLDLFNFDGHVYLLPYVYNTVQWWYNKDVLAKAGVQPPTTWDEFLAMSEAVKKAGFAPIAMDPDYHMFNFVALMNRLKGKGFLLKALTDKTGEMWKDPAFAQAIGIERDLWAKGYIPKETEGYTWPQGQQTLALGQAGYEFCGSWLPAELKDTAGPDFKWGSFNWPAISGGAGSQDSLQAFLLTFMILKDSPHPVEASDFLKFIMTKENQKIMVDVGIVGVTRKGVDWPAAVADGETAAANAKELYLDGDGGTALHPDILNNVLTPHHLEVFLGKITAQQFADTMASESKTYWSSHDK